MAGWECLSVYAVTSVIQYLKSESWYWGLLGQIRVMLVNVRVHELMS